MVGKFPMLIWTLAAQLAFVVVLSDHLDRLVRKSNRLQQEALEAKPKFAVAAG